MNDATATVLVAIAVLAVILITSGDPDLIDALIYNWMLPECR